MGTQVRPVSSLDQMRIDDEEDTKRAFTEDELNEARRQPNKAVISRPPLLGYASVVLIIVNRMVGTGIFRTPTKLAHGTHSVAYSLALWAIGGIVTVCGAHVFAEFGLTIPRLDVDDEGKQFVPRNGGEKNYIEYFFKKPRLLATCIYGIPFVIMGNMAGNCLIFAQSVLSANGQEVDGWTMRGVAIGIATFACTFHAFWRKGGVYLNNFFGVIKVTILFTLFVLGAAYAGGQFGGSSATGRHNLDIDNSAANATADAYGFAEAFLGILFAYGGFNQASYVLGEIKDTRTRFKWTTITTVACVSALYFLVNLAYMLVVPSSAQFADGDDTVASNFFRILFGADDAPKIESALLAFSSLGNIIVQTFTAARVKQEIAKEGVLPFSKFFAKNYSLTPKWLRSKNDTGSEDTPAGALLLHWTFAVLLIFATVPSQDDSYGILVSVYSFTIDAIFGFMVGLSLLILRFRKASKWSRISSSDRWVSITTAAIFTLAKLFPLVAIWIPPSSKEAASLSLTGTWFIVGTIGMGLIGFAVLYWVLLHYVLPSLRGRELEVDREYNFIKDRGAWVMWHEIVSFKWKSV